MPVTTVPDKDAPLVGWAQWYAEQGWPVFPCRGKVPAIAGGHGYLDATIDPFQIATWWRQYPQSNIGLPMDDFRFALDIDPRNGGDNSLFDLERTYAPLPHTLLTLTGSGGTHSHWTSSRPVIHKAQIGSGIDVIAKGGYVIAPPSIHPDTGKPYLWDLMDGPEDIAIQPAPDWLEHLVTTMAGTTSPVAPLSPDTPIADGERDDTLSRMVVRMCRAGISLDAIRAALDIENERCVHPMTPAELDRIMRGKAHYTPDPVLLISSPAPTQQLPPFGWSQHGGAPPPMAPPLDWRNHLASKKTGGLVQDVRNFSLILEHAEYWRGQLWWDDVGSKPMFGRHEIDDDFLVGIGKWFGTEESLSVTNLRMLERCVLSRCRTNKHDTLKYWLNGLPPWDTVPRLTMWLTDIAGVEPTVYGQDVSRMLLLSMVARAMEPGCICRYVVILEGPEEVGKSQLVQALASEQWYVVLSMGLDSKDAHMMLQNAWIAEMAELDSLTKTEEARLKAFITMRHDSYIPKYSNFRESHPRRAIFVGTTNEEGYLKGQTGNTRFLPVKVTKQIDIEGFGFIREQLFAEALVTWRGTPEWWKLSDEGAATAIEERERRRVINVYEQPLHEWLEYGRFTTPVYDNGKVVTFIQGETSWQEIAQWYLQLKTPAEWKDQNLQKQVAQALKTLGWKQQIVWRHGRTSKLWQKA